MFLPKYNTLWCSLFLAIFVLLGPVSVPAHESEWPGQKLATIFPKAEKFVQRSAVITPAKLAKIEKELDSKLRKEDHKPVFYLALNKKKKPIGLVLFVDVQGPHGIIDGAVGLNLKGKVVKVAVYNHKESDAIASEPFLNQFIGMGINSAFKVGEDVKPITGHEAASLAVTLLPKKTLVMSYALFLKKKPAPQTDKTTAKEETPEVNDLHQLMMLMIDSYLDIVEYFDTGQDKAKAVKAVKKLIVYAGLIANFEPPKNTGKIEEYTAMQTQFTEILTKFADELQKSGISDETRQQWKAVVEIVNQAHRKFSDEEIDLETR